ncbi:MAG: hypothetical protein J6B17_02615 [Ruminococcus sp.]|nr:hypothetical protein [Ruminococcus sp.]
MRAAERTLLHFAAYNALLLTVYPVIAMIFHYSGETSLQVWLSELFVILTGWIALFHAVLIRRMYRKKPVLVNTGFFAAGALAAFIAAVITPLDGTFMAVVSAIAVFAVYQAGARLFFIEYDSLTHTYVYVSVCMVFILTSAVIWIGDHKTSLLWQVILFLLISAVFALARNFSSIDDALRSQGDDSAPLPDGILKYNRLLLCAVGAGMMVLILLRKYIGGFLWTIVKAAIHYIGKAIYWFVGLFIGEEKKAAELSETPNIIQQTAVSRNEWLTLVCTVILSGIVIFLLIRYREKIISAIVNTGRSISSWIAHLFGRSYEKQEHSTSGGYTDHHIELSADVSVQKNNTTPHMKWKHELKRFRRMDNSAEKYRFGYSLLLYKLDGNGIPVKQYETPFEVWQSIPHDKTYRKDMERVTLYYEKVRYSEDVPDKNETAFLERFLEEKF